LSGVKNSQKGWIDYRSHGAKPPEIFDTLLERKTLITILCQDADALATQPGGDSDNRFLVPRV